jgi:NAD(P)H-dependent FMN reductase
VHVLAIAGSLRALSINAAFCRAAARLAPAGLRIIPYGSLGSLPLFNPDLEVSPPIAVIDFREAVAEAHALLIASPEYAHGVSGVLKNALDWLVSFEGFIGKPVALINTSPRAHHAYEATSEVLRTMCATLIREASITVPLLGHCTTEEQMLGSRDISLQISSGLTALASFLRSHRSESAIFPVG